MHLAMDHTYDEPDTVRSMPWAEAVRWQVVIASVAWGLALWALWRWL